tara:strand:+ start:2822 stop:3403 length:582 start_codon:yes stop_codon:yes gene_type:complete
MAPAETQAKDLGVHGDLFPITEPDILMVIRARLTALGKVGEIDRLNREFRDRAVASIKRPPVIYGIQHTSEPRQWFFDPTITVAEDIMDNEGHLIHAAGTRVNPLEVMGLTQKILFIDGDDKDQVEWALTERTTAGRAKIVLVRGAPLELMETHKVPFYFDQRGLLTSRFQIAQVPARIEQIGSLLSISEVKP